MLRRSFILFIFFICHSPCLLESLFIYTLIKFLSHFQPQNEHIELHRKRHGYRLDYHEKKRKKEGRKPHEMSKKAKKLRGIKGIEY